MAGRISLGVLVSFLLVGFGWALHREQRRSAELPFKVVRVASEHDADAVTADGKEAPFTVLVYECPQIKRTVSGVIGNVGDEIWMTPPSGNR